VKFLLDTRVDEITRRLETHPDLIAGQLLTPLTRYTRREGMWACDNGSFSRFNAPAFLSLLKRNEAGRDSCLFVAAPDVVGSARRTLEIFSHWYCKISKWPIALVAQDGIEDLAIQWDMLSAIFIGGTTDWKDSKAAADVVKTAIAVGCHVHVGRVNTPRRWKHFADIGADTCDGSGVSRFDWMLDKIAAGRWDDHPLFAAELQETP
jgi:hypothetical protein